MKADRELAALAAAAIAYRIHSLSWINQGRQHEEVPHYVISARRAILGAAMDYAKALEAREGHTAS